MGIPIGNRHYCTVAGEKIKEQICEKCGIKFNYQLQRTATGESVNLFWLDNKGAAEAAKELAARQLRWRLRKEFDIIA